MCLKDHAQAINYNNNLTAVKRHGQSGVSERSLAGEKYTILTLLPHKLKQMENYNVEKNYDLLLSQNAALEAEVKRLQQLVAELTDKCEMRKVRPLNDYLYSDVTRKASFREQMIALIGTDRPIERMSRNINQITFIDIRHSVYGSLTSVMTVIVRHTRKKHFAMIRPGRNPHGYRPSPERIEYFHTLHAIFSINESDRQQVRNFDQRLKAVISQTTLTNEKNRKP